MDAGDVVGKTVLVGLTYVDANGSIREREEWCGVVVAFDSAEGVQVRRPSGEIDTLPPILERAEPGDYTLRGTGEVVSNPDFVCTWTITEPGDAPAGSDDRTEPVVDEVSEWATFYDERRDVYDEFAGRLNRLLDTLLEEEDLYPWILTFSVPEWVDLAQAIVRARRAADVRGDPLDSHLRVAGLEVGVNSPDEVPAVEEVIRREFVVDSWASRTFEEVAERREHAGSPGGSDALAYEFPYYVVSLDERRLELPEWSRFAGVKLRLEVKTELQDAWVSIVDGLPWRAADDYPPEIRDVLAESARAVASADADLEQAQELIVRTIDEYEGAVAAGDLGLSLNGISLLAYLRTSELVESLCDAGRDVGLRRDPDYEPGFADIERSLWLLQRAGVGTLAELDDFLRQATPRARDVLSELARVANEEGFTPWADADDVVEWLWLVLNRADAETVALTWYRGELENALNTLIGNPVARSHDSGE
jgi:hypothetical protein